MPNNSSTHNEDTANQMMQMGNNFGKKPGGKAGKGIKKALNKVAKKAMKLIVKLVGWIIKAIIIPLLPYILIFFLIILLVYIGWELLFNSRGKTQDMQNDDVKEHNTVAPNKKGEYEAKDLSFGNKMVKSFYTYFSEKSIWITSTDEGIKEPIQYNSPEFIRKFGEGDDVKLKDKYQREKKFYISPNALWTLDEFLNKNQFKFPEQFVKHVPYDEKTYQLKPLTDDKGKLIAESEEYSTSTKKPTGKKVKGVWDYGFGSILNYKKYIEESKKKGNFSETEFWDKKEQKTVRKTFSDAQAMIKNEPGRYEGFDESYDGKDYVKPMPEETKESYMIDRVITPAGNISNKIVHEWADSGKTFGDDGRDFTELTKSVTEKYKVTEVDKESKEIYLGCNESQTVTVHVDLKGNKTTKTFTNSCNATSDDGTDPHATHEKKKFTYTLETEKEVEKERKVDKKFKVYAKGTIWKKEPRYEGDPDTSEITGSKYYQDYMFNYKTYVPENVKGHFNFDDIRRRTGKTDKDLLKLLEREPFGGGSDQKTNVDMGDFKLGSGASADSFKNSMQYFDIVQDEAKKFGIDPYFVISYMAQESGGNENSDGAAYGLLQLEKSVYFNKPMTLKYLDGTTETVTPSYATMRNNPRMQIRIGCNELRIQASQVGYNPIMALQAYNTGMGGFKTIVAKYASEKFNLPYNNVTYDRQSKEIKAKVEEIIKSGDLGWMADRQWYKESGHTVYGSAGGGNPKHIEMCLQYYTSVNGEVPWVIDDKGNKISMNGNIEMGVGTGATGGANDSWLSSIWDKFKKGWNKLFPDIPEELPKERVSFEYRVPEKQTDTIIKMMFVMEEHKYLTDYDDFKDADWKEKFHVLFSNPLGSPWGGDTAPPTVNPAEFFKDGFVSPLEGNKLTIKTPYSLEHSGIDIVATKNQKVLSVADGEVIDVDSSSSRGKFIKVDYGNGVQVVYGNLDSTSVKKGDKVKKGQEIGKTGDTLREGSVLHFELSKNSVNQNPSWIVTGYFNPKDYKMSEEDYKVISQVIQTAKSKIGCRYTQAEGERNGPNSFDCSGFVNYLYKQATGITIGSWTGEQVQVLKNYRVPMDKIQPGDLVFNPHHVVLYIGDNKIIHASNSKPYPAGGVKESSLYAGLTDVYRPIAYINAQKTKK